MITSQTQSALNVIQNVLVNATDDDLNEVIQKLEDLLFTAKEIANTTASINDGSDYNPLTYCNIPKRY